MPTHPPITFTNPEFQLLWQAMLNAEDDLSFTLALQSLAENIHLLYNDDAVTALTDALFYAQMAAWNAGISSTLAEANRSTDSIHATRKCKAKNPARCKFHTNTPALLDAHTAFNRLCRRRIIKDKQNREIIFGSKLYEHLFKHNNATRKKRATSILFAEDTVSNGTPSTDPRNNRRIYTKTYNFDQHNLIMKVVCVDYPSKNRKEVLTYHFFHK